jgi:hypothetical protein
LLSRALFQPSSTVLVAAVIDQQAAGIDLILNIGRQGRGFSGRP